jgi:hypothetical protein
MMHDKGFRIVIFSGRLDVTKEATKRWLEDNGIKWDILKMRPQHMKFVDDAELKKEWLHELGKDSVFLVVDDRKKVVDMWRREGMDVWQVAEGDF